MQMYECCECHTRYDKHTVPANRMCTDAACPGNGMGMILEAKAPAPGKSNGQAAGPAPSDRSSKEAGYCLFLMDASGSMFEEMAFPDFPDLPSEFGDPFLSRAEMVTRLAANAIFSMANTSDREHAYIGAIGFDHRTEPLFTESIAGLIRRFPSAREFSRYLFDALGKLRGGTNINAVLDLAHQACAGYLNGQIEGVGPIRPKIHRQLIPERGAINIPNMRILLWSDGEHQQEHFGALHSPFQGMYPNLLLSTYIGPDSGAGCDDLRQLAGCCPIHKEQQFFLLDRPDKVANLRNIFRMASGASGFCQKCMPVHVHR